MSEATAGSGHDHPGLSLPPELVTGEAVVLELRPASFATRAMAWALDTLVLVIAAVVLFVTTAVVAGSLDDAAESALALTCLVGLLIGVPVTVETLTRGRSLGKLAAGLRVVRDDGGPVRMRQALVRALLAYPEIWLTGGSVALITSLSNPRGKRLGDLLAGTYVIRERAPAPPPPVGMPPELANWAAGTDLARIPDRLAQTCRAYLGRAAMLHPQSRVQLGMQLAGQLSRYVAPSPPGVVDPERYLAAVLAERRRRDLARLERERRARGVRAERRARGSVLAPTSSRLVGDEDG
jgi:uncharacterized RDD family membrane protein YckC